VGGDLTLYLPGDPIAGYLAMPSDPGPWPGVVVLHQVFGLDDDIRRITDRLAGLGYLAVAPDLLAGGGVKCLARLFLDVQRGKGDAVDTVQDVVDWISDRADCNGRVGVIGFCVGGGLAFLLGMTGTVHAVAPNYGRAPKAERLARSCPVVASFGRKDRLFAGGAVRAERGLSSAGVDHDVKVYDEAGHGFMNQVEDLRLLRALTWPFMTVDYDRAAAEDAWSRIETFFERYLSTPS
jgi:carboxymethylenebutenolidase